MKRVFVVAIAAAALLLAAARGSEAVVPTSEIVSTTHSTNSPRVALTWETAFATQKAPAKVHFRATYSDPQGRSHTVTQWRDGEERLRRDTDDVMSIFVTKQSHGEYRHQVIDKKAGVQVEVSRTNLHRLGVFSDWSAMATNVTRPNVPYTLFASSRGTQNTKFGGCRFVRMEVEGSPAREVCWSESWAMPMLIDVETERGSRREYSVEEIESDVDLHLLDPPRSGYLEIDANEELGFGD